MNEAISEKIHFNIEEKRKFGKKLKYTTRSEIGFFRVNNQAEK